MLGHGPRPRKRQWVCRGEGHIIGREHTSFLGCVWMKAPLVQLAAPAAALIDSVDDAVVGDVEEGLGLVGGQPGFVDALVGR